MKIVALHGFLGLATDWNSVFSETDFEFDAVDLWPIASRVRVESAFEDCAEEILVHAKDRPWLLGYSMGGRLAYHAYLRAPEKWAGAIFVSAHPGLIAEEEKRVRLESDEKWARRFREDPWDVLMRDWNKQGVFTGDGSGLSSRLETTFDREALARAMDIWSLGRQTDLSERLSELKSFNWCITGDLDKKFTSLIQAMGLGKRHIQIAGAGHRVPWDQPAQFRDVVRSLNP